jgi:hypothetical protein
MPGGFKALDPNLPIGPINTARPQPEVKIPRHQLPNELRPDELRLEDGCGNTYSVLSTGSGVTFEYIPISSRSSSSLVYSGGPHVSHESVPVELYDQLLAAAKAAETDTGSHAKQRMKGTWRVQQAHHPEVLLAMDSAAAEKIDLVLRRMRTL